MFTKLRKSDGFLLLEVLIAVGILAVGMLIALRAMSISALAEREADDYTNALLLLREKSGELSDMGAGALASQFPMRGDFGTRAEGFSWSAEQTREPELKGEWLKISVLWERDGKEMSAETRMMIAANARGGNANGK